jgi:predicted short-subunit dehydrogenase-like oxidoreductase (DUF2520 family)
MSSIVFIGAGRVARALAPALVMQGVMVAAVASRQPAAAAALAASLPGCEALPEQAAVDRAGLVFLTVPDDQIAGVARSLHWRPGQQVVHCSGATEVGVLQPAAEAGAEVGGFHPLQIFSDPTLAIGLLAGSSVAIEATGALDARLRQLAGALRLSVVELPHGARARYHAGASHAASFLLSVLHEAVQLWASFGVPEDQALQALLPLSRGTLASAASRGLAGAVSGPISRGDVGVLAHQLAELDHLGPLHGSFFRALAQRQLPLIARSGRLDAAQQQALQALLQTPPSASV